MSAPPKMSKSVTFLRIFTISHPSNKNFKICNYLFKKNTAPKGIGGRLLSIRFFPYFCPLIIACPIDLFNPIKSTFLNFLNFFKAFKLIVFLTFLRKPAQAGVGLGAPVHPRQPAERGPRLWYQEPSALSGAAGGRGLRSGGTWHCQAPLFF